MGEGNGCHIEGLSRCKLQSMADCEELLAQVLHALSAIASTSHTIFTISLYSANYVRNPDPNLAPKQTLTPLSKLHLVDLASGKRPPSTILTHALCSKCDTRHWLHAVAHGSNLVEAAESKSRSLF